MTDSIYTIGNRTRNQPDCSAVPQLTAPPRAALSNIITVIKLRNSVYSGQVLGDVRNLERYSGPQAGGDAWGLQSRLKNSTASKHPVAASHYPKKD